MVQSFRGHLVIFLVALSGLQRTGEKGCDGLPQATTAHLAERIWSRTVECGSVDLCLCEGAGSVMHFLFFSMWAPCQNLLIQTALRTAKTMTNICLILV